MAVVKLITSQPSTIAHAVHSLGAYFFKPTTLQTLKAAGSCTLGGILSSDSPNSAKLSDKTTVYLLGFVASKFSRKFSGDYTYKALDEHSVSLNETYIGNVTIFRVYTKADYSDYAVTTVEFAGISEIQNLMKVIGVQSILKSGAISEQVYNAMHVSSTKPIEHDTPAMTRTEILDMLKKARSCSFETGSCSGDCDKCAYHVDSVTMVHVYDAVIKAYEQTLKQGATNKCVRMADGSRKWFPPSEAAELLKLPREERK